MWSWSRNDGQENQHWTGVTLLTCAVSKWLKGHIHGPVFWYQCSVPVSGVSCWQTNRTCTILKPTGTSDWHQWNSGTSDMTHTPVYWCKLTGTATGTRKLVSVYGPLTMTSVDHTRITEIPQQTLQMLLITLWHKAAAVETCYYEAGQMSHCDL